MRFDTYEQAEAKAVALRKRRKLKQYATAPFSSYVVQAVQ